MADAQPTVQMSLFGDELVRGDGVRVSPEASLSGKIVGVYFSAHWCGPCRAFTPRFAELYRDTLRARNLEVVFVSSDRSSSEWDAYRTEMPWLAVPFDAPEVREALSSRFAVASIPTLVLLDSDGREITRDGHDLVRADQHGAAFPWRALPFDVALGDVLRGAGGDKLARAEALQGKTTVLLFGALANAESRAAVGQLSHKYRAWVGDNARRTGPLADRVEFVFVSYGDREESQFDAFVELMPWPALPFSHREGAFALARRFQVSAVPKVVIVQEDGVVTNGDALSDLQRDESDSGDLFPWAPAPVLDLERGAPGLNERRSMVLFLDGVEAGDALQSRHAYTRVAMATRAARHGEAPPFFIEQRRCPISAQLRRFVQLAPDSQPHLMMMDIADEGGFYVWEDESPTIDDEAVRMFMRAVLGGMLPRRQMVR